MFFIHLVEEFCTLGFPTWGAGPKMALPMEVRRSVSGYRCNSDATNMSHVPHPPSGRFLCPWFPHLGPGPKIAPSLVGAEMGLGTMMRPTCHMFLIHLVEDSAPLVSPPGAWAQDITPLGGVPRWASGYRPATWRRVMQPTCHMFHIHLVEDFRVLGFPTWALGPRWHSLGGCRVGSRAIGLLPGGQ